MKFVLLFSIVLLAGCTYSPPLSKSTTVAPVGNAIDAGIIRAMYTPEGSFDGWLVRQSTVDELNSYLTKYGASLIPPLKPGYGVAPYLGYHKMTAEAVDLLAEFKQGLLP